MGCVGFVSQQNKSRQRNSVDGQANCRRLREAFALALSRASRGFLALKRERKENSEPQVGQVGILNE